MRWTSRRARRPPRTGRSSSSATGRRRSRALAEPQAAEHPGVGGAPEPVARLEARDRGAREADPPAVDEDVVDLVVEIRPPALPVGPQELGLQAAPERVVRAAVEEPVVEEEAMRARVALPDRRPHVGVEVAEQDDAPAVR